MMYSKSPVWQAAASQGLEGELVVPAQLHPRICVTTAGASTSYTAWVSLLLTAPLYVTQRSNQPGRVVPYTAGRTSTEPEALAE